MNLSTHLLIDGELVKGEGPAVEITNPATKGSSTGRDMSVYALDAYTSIRHIMFAH